MEYELIERLKNRVVNDLLENFKGNVHVAFNTTFLYVRIRNDVYGEVEYFDKKIYAKIYLGVFNTEEIIESLRKDIIRELRKRVFK